jgi:hypothetical protein
MFAAFSRKVVISALLIAADDITTHTDDITILLLNTEI